MSRTTFGPRQRALIEKAAERGPWRPDRFGRVRNLDGLCPLYVATDTRDIWSARRVSGLGESTRGIIRAADNPGDPRRPELLRLLGVEEASWT